MADLLVSGGIGAALEHAAVGRLDAKRPGRQSAIQAAAWAFWSELVAG